MRASLWNLAARLLILAVVLAVARQAQAHDQWGDGAPVPPWVKGSCCGLEDVHHRTASQIHAMADGWHVDGLRTIIPYGRELPLRTATTGFSIGYGRTANRRRFYCFFAPALELLSLPCASSQHGARRPGFRFTAD
ncbi:hypothetical protein SAMN05519103_03122 [Rhizobiales bacterium GAS113]|nr:hypothetical protein SAMN05519103_03122 [Rhizobiales bacterium GAS113]